MPLSDALLRGYRKAALRVEALPLEAIGFSALAAGIALRLAAPFFMDFRSDGDTYTAMGHAWSMFHEFRMPYGDVTTWAAGAPDCTPDVDMSCPGSHSHHYPPAYPFYLGLVFSLFGFGLVQTKVAAVVMSLLALAAVYWTTRDLYGKVPAALTAGLIALEPHFVWTTGTGFSENMVLLFFALTMWAILRSLADDRFIVLAGLFAGLAYLTRSSVGYFFVVAGMGGLLWRLTFRGWSVFTNRWYLGAIGVFGLIGAAWGWRNFALFGYEWESFAASEYLMWGALALAAAAAVLAVPFLANRSLRTPRNFVPHLALLGLAVALGAFVVAGRSTGIGAAFLAERYRPPVWYTSSYVDYVQLFALQRPGEWWAALVRKVPYFILFLAWWVVPFLPESWRATKRIREESTSALWLSIALVWLIAWVVSGMFTVFEKVDFISNNHRYVVIGLLPLAWLVFREARLERASTRLRVVLLAVSLLAASGAVFADPVRYSDLRAAEHMDPFLRAGDEVAVDGASIKYAFYAYLTRPETIQVYGCEDPDAGGNRSGPCHGEKDAHGKQADFVLSLRYFASYQGYALVGTFNQKFSDGNTMTATLWARDDVVRERSIATNQVRNFE